MKKIVLALFSGIFIVMALFGFTNAQKQKPFSSYPLDGYRPNIDYMDNQILLLVPENTKNAEIFLVNLSKALKNIGAYFNRKPLESIKNLKTDSTLIPNVCGGDLLTIRLNRPIDKYLWETVTEKIKKVAVDSGINPDILSPAPNDGMRMPQSNELGVSDLEASIPFSMIKNATTLQNPQSINNSTIPVAVIDSGFTEIDGSFSRFNQADGVNLTSNFDRDLWTKDDYKVQINSTQHPHVYGHGSIIARFITEIAPQVQIIPIKACVNIFCTGRNVVAGICWAISKGAKVINISAAGFVQSNLMRSAVLEATQAGVLVVASAGNSRNFNWAPNVTFTFNSKAYPAAWAAAGLAPDSIIPIPANDGLISVGAINGCSVPTIAGYSHIGSTVTVATYGKIQLPYSLQPRNPADPIHPLEFRNQPTSTRAGTSFATPIISALAAIKIQQSNGRITPIEIRRLMASGATTAIDNQLLSESIPRASGRCSNLNETPVEIGYTRVDTRIPVLQLSDFSVLIRP
jgi:subtilisin family serine protease